MALTVIMSWVVIQLKIAWIIQISDCLWLSRNMKVSGDFFACDVLRSTMSRIFNAQHTKIEKRA